MIYKKTFSNKGLFFADNNNNKIVLFSILTKEKIITQIFKPNFWNSIILHHLKFELKPFYNLPML